MSDPNIRAIADQVAEISGRHLRQLFRERYGYDFPGDQRAADSLLSGAINALSQVNADCSLDAALAFAVRACEQMPTSPAREPTIRWLQSIREQQGCHGWHWVETHDDGSIDIGVPEGDRLVDLISVIIRG